MKKGAEVNINKIMFEQQVDYLIGETLEGCDSPEGRLRCYQEIIEYGCNMGVPNLTYTIDILKVYDAHEDYIQGLYEERCIKPDDISEDRVKTLATFFAFEFIASEFLENEYKTK